MFSQSTSSPGTIFQTYLLPATPFRRRQSSSSTVSSSFSPRQSTHGFPPISASPTSPITPASPTDNSFFTANCGSAAYRNSPFGYSYDFQPAAASAWTRHNSSDSQSSLTTSPTATSYLSGNTSHISCGKCHADLALTSQIISKGFTGRHGRAYLIAPLPTSLINSPSSANSGQESPPLPNTHVSKPVPRHLVTGLHTVADLSCALCGLVVGWKYVAAEEPTQRYKVGKFILETRRCSVGAFWENAAPNVEAGEEDDGSWFFGGAGMEGVEGRSRRASTRRVGLLGAVSNSSSRASDSYDDEDDEDEDYGGYVENEDIIFDSQDEDECEDLFAGIWSPQLAKRRRARKAQLAH